jgi:hypothetical protein
MNSRHTYLAAALLGLTLALSGIASGQGLAACQDGMCDEASAGLEAIQPVSIFPVLPILPASMNPTEKRLFGVIPNYRADQLQKTYQPLSVREKFEIAHGDSFDWPNYFLLAGFALQSQIASGGIKQNGGATGFVKFYTRSFGDQIIGSYVTEAILPSLLHEDPRFFRLGTGSLWHRASYAALAVFVVRTDDGGRRFNISEVAGNAGVVAATTAYYPASQTAAQGATRFAMQLGNDLISNLLTEFWPDIKRRLPFHRT